MKVKKLNKNLSKKNKNNGTLIPFFLFITIITMPSIELVHTLPSLFYARVVRKPSIHIRSPYMADIVLEDGTPSTCYIPGIESGGLVKPGALLGICEAVLPSKSKWVAYLVHDALRIPIGIHPDILSQSIYPLLHTFHQEADWTWGPMLYCGRIDYMGYLPDGNKIYVNVEPTAKSDGRGTAYFPEKATSVSLTKLERFAMLMEEPDTHSCHVIVSLPYDRVAYNPDEPEYCDMIRASLSVGVQFHMYKFKYDMEGMVTYVDTKISLLVE